MARLGYNIGQCYNRFQSDFGACDTERLVRLRVLFGCLGMGAGMVLECLGSLCCLPESWGALGVGGIWVGYNVLNSTPRP